MLAGEELIGTSWHNFPPFNEYSSSLSPPTSSLTPNMAIRHHVITMCVQHTKGTIYKNLLKRCGTTWRSSKAYVLIEYAPRKRPNIEWNTCFMNEVTSRFGPNLRPKHDNKVSGDLAPPQIQNMIKMRTNVIPVLCVFFERTIHSWYRFDHYRWFSMSRRQFQDKKCNKCDLK